MYIYLWGYGNFSYFGRERPWRPKRIGWMLNLVAQYSTAQLIELTMYTMQWTVRGKKMAWQSALSSSYDCHWRWFTVICWWHSWSAQWWCKQPCKGDQIYDKGKNGNLAESWPLQKLYMWLQKGTGELLAEVKPIMVRQGIHVLIPTHVNISCKYIRKTSLAFTKHNTVVIDEDKFRPITTSVNWYAHKYAYHIMAGNFWGC